MQSSSGYFLLLKDDRRSTFENNVSEGFGEPVPDFDHSRNIPLIGFVFDDKKMITHVGMCRRGKMAGTGLRRLNVIDVTQLSRPISAIEITNEVSGTPKKHIENRIKYGGLLPPKSFEAFLAALLKKVPELKALLEKFGEERRKRLARLSDKQKEALAEQKEAVMTALNIAGFDKSVATGWDYTPNETPKSFLDGIPSAYLLEDQMIINDLSNFPGFDRLGTTSYTTSSFENETTRLTVVLANRLPLELLLGTDLIYYNEDFKCFVMVQYKVMEREGSKFNLRLPDQQLEEEISRMDDMSKVLSAIPETDNLNDYRISSNPFFLKLCPRIEFNPDNAGLSSGMYLPLDYFKKLQADKSIKGRAGGMAINFDNVGRYFDNSDFARFVECSWIGTHIDQSAELVMMIRQIVERGRTAVVAIKKKIRS
jgi:hypothetical protein